MSIRRAARPQSDYLIVHNQISRDSRLSYRARGILIDILSRPDDWSISTQRIADLSPSEGRDAIRSALRELVAVGYAEHRKCQDDRGRWSTETVVYDQPKTDKPTPDEPTPDEPTPDEPSPIEVSKNEVPIDEVPIDEQRAPAVLETPAWAEQARAFPVGRSGLTDCWEDVDPDWKPCQAAHIWQRGTIRRDLLWEAVDAEMPISNERERGRRAKAVSLLRESDVDPTEFATLRRVYLWKSDGKWADTDIAIAGRVADLRRWANESTTIPSRAAINNQIEQEKQRRAHLKAIEAGPGVTAYDRIRRTP